jgi:integrase
MSLKKRGKYYYVRFKIGGREIYRSTNTSNKAEAREFEARLKKQHWDASHLDKIPDQYWVSAVTRYLKESSKKTLHDDASIIKWLDKYLHDKTLKQIDATCIENIKQEKIKEGAAPATINHYLRVITTILRKCKKWGWLSDVPVTERLTLDNKRMRWLSFDEADKLLLELPSHLSSLAAFTLATGLRSRNARLLKWSQIDFERKHAFVDAIDVKNKKALAVPLNDDALAILSRQPRINEFVFNYKDLPVGECNTKAFKNALKRCGIENFRWHDLRHTWASWHIQSGTSLQELQALGGWSDFAMVLRYAHLSSEHLQNAADRIKRAKRGQPMLKVVND